MRRRQPHREGVEVAASQEGPHLAHGELAIATVSIRPPHNRLRRVAKAVRERRVVGGVEVCLFATGLIGVAIEVQRALAMSRVALRPRGESRLCSSSGSCFITCNPCIHASMSDMTLWYDY